ncbi:MAG: hypothetical protein EHM64_08790 [Ignavibacteriae bacterium]|nr:MAG: hypothetical protein EHM64_08790 [Ignavibacteriota bacterium]
MNTLNIILYVILLLFLCYLTYSLATDYQQNSTRNRCSFVIWVIDTIDLFIHETGHLVFRLFGRFMGFLGGSLFQVIIPLATVIVFARSSLYSLPVTLYWTGQSVVNVSVYIGDAPFQRLQLISRAAIHDWRWLLNSAGMMEYAEDISSVVNILGLLTCVAGIGIGIYLAVRRRPVLPQPQE